MKIKQFLSKFIALTLVITIVFSIFTVSASAVTNDKNASSQNANIQNNLTVQGTNSVGTMLASEIEEKNEETDENNGCNVFSVEVMGNEAAVSFETVVDATLLVAVYNESCATLITTGTTEVEKGETEKNVTFDTEEMPQYFYLKGYLIDTETNKPLCTAYSSPMYTKEMQEFLAKTTDDFDEDKVLNFDNEKDNNFAVYKENVKLVDDSSDKNKVTKSDDTTKTYVIENIDESISSLKEGDIFSYNYSDGSALVVKVASITIDGTTATVIGADAEINEVFDYMKIDSTAKKSDYTYDGSDVDDGVTVLKTDNDNKRNSRNARAIVDVDNSDSFSMSFGFDYAKEKEVSIGGSLSTTFTTKIKVYVSLFYQYIELTVSQVSKFNVNISVNFPEISIKLGEFSIIPVAGLRICFEPALVVSGKITVNLNFTLTSKAGFSYSSDNGFKNLSTTDDPGIELNVTGELFIGIKITVKVLVAEKLANFGITGKAGILINLKVSTNQISDSVKHECLQCAEGEINAKISVSPYAKFLDSDKLKLEDTFSISFKLCDIYYSKSHLEFGFTTCPHKKYKVTVVVKDSNGNLVKDAYINGAQKTDATGTAIVYLPKGQNEVSVLKDDKVTQKIVEVLSAAKSTVIIIPAKQDSSEENPDYEPVLTGEIVQIAAGGNSSAAVTKDGDLYMWGANGAGQLGIQSNASKNVSTLVNDSSSTLPEKSVKYVSLGDNHSAAITKDGSLYMWGYNRNGQLGDGTTIDSYMPQKIMENVVMVSLGSSHSAAITKDGSLYMWGYNGWGELGDGTTSEKHVPKKIMENVVTVSLGGSHSAAITKDGSLYTWGYNCWGELGNGSANYSTKPQKIMDNVVTVSLGRSHSAAVTKDGSLYTWGYNCYGQLGDGTNSYKTKPQKIATNVSKVELGNYHSIAISKDGGLYAWGDNAGGQFGNDTQNSSLVPVKIMSNVVESVTGNNHTMVLKKDGNIYTWGDNANGQLGDKTYTDKLSPVKIEIYNRIPVLTLNGLKYGIKPNNGNYNFSFSGEAAQIAAGGNSSAAVTKDGDLYMWGANGAGQLGIQSNASKNVSTLVNDSSSTLPEKSVKYVSLGDNHSAAITKDGSLYMWGYNRNGQLGDGTTIDSYMPQKIMENVVMVSLGSSHSAAITKDGSLYMWGYNGWGELGDGTTSEKHVPKKIMENVVTVSLGGSHSAAITKDGSLYTWGYNCWGELGNGSANYSTKPQKIMDNVVTVSLGRSHSAAVTKDGSLYTWGYNCYGQLGDGTNSYKTKPQKIATNVSKVELGNYHSIAISKDGGLYAWGDNAGGQFGNGTQNSSLVPVKIMSNVVGSVAGYNHTLILKKDGTLYTCGQNGFGQLGDETNTNKLSPVKISIYDRIPVLHSIKEPLIPVGASSTQRTAKFTGYSANGIYNFYSVKDKNADKLLTDDNILYVDQVRADANGNITVTYNAKADCISPYEFVASITQIDIGNAEVTAESLTYNGKMQTVEPVVKVNGYTLYNGIDYKLTGEYEVKDVGEYTYTIIGQGDFVGYITKTFTINPADVNTCDASSISAKTYTGTEIQPDVELTMDNDTLKKDVDYTVEYQNNVNAGIGIVVIKGMGNYSGRKVCWFDITKCDVSKINITIPICTYYGDTVIPEMILENNGIALVKDKDYTVTFKNNTSVGTATAVISGIGNYSGTVEKKFQIREPFGDVDMNGKIDVNDVTIIMAYNVELMNLSSEQLKFADVNEDGYVDVSDATLIQQYIADCI